MAAGTFTFQNSSNVDIATTIKVLGGRAGLVFDYVPSAGSFNFAALLGDKNQVVLGHYTKAGGFVFDAVQNLSSIGNSPVLEIVANGDLVNVLINGTQLLSYNYGEVVTNGRFGLLSWTGSNTFGALTVTTNDPAFAASSGATKLQLASGPAPTDASGAPLTPAQLAPIVAEADQLWIAALGPNDARLSALTTVTIEIGALPGLELGATHDGVITISSNAAGWGWFIDPTPGNNSEFSTPISNVALLANSSSPAYGHMDLLSTVLHELGNAMGFAEDQGQDVTGMVLLPGERRLPGTMDSTSGSSSLMPGVFSPWAAVGASGPGRSSAEGGASAPAIDWSPARSPLMDGRGLVDPDGVPDWLSDFLNNVGVDSLKRNPNAGIRIKPGVGH